MKRKLEESFEMSAPSRPIKRLSMLDNTPQQWKEQRRRILKLSKDKLKDIKDVDCNLRISVLVNNTYRKMKRELRETNCSTNWQYTPKPLFPNRTQSVLSYYNCEMEWDREKVTHEQDEKELSPASADLSVVLSDILEESSEKVVKSSSDIVKSTECSDIEDSDGNQPESECGVSVSPADSSTHQPAVLNNPTVSEQDVKSGSSECDSVQEEPIDYRVRKQSRSEQGNVICDPQVNQSMTPPSQTYSNSQVSMDVTSDNDSTVVSSSSVHSDEKPQNASFKDFVIGGRMDWSQSCMESSNLVYSAVGSMLPLFDLSNRQPTTTPNHQHNKSSAINTLNCTTGCTVNNGGISAAKSGQNSSGENRNTIHCDHTEVSSISNSGFSVFDYDVLDLKTSKVKSTNGLCLNGSGAENSSCTQALPVEIGSNVSSCDMDINQELWACFQQFNMAIACS